MGCTNSKTIEKNKKENIIIRNSLLNDIEDPPLNNDIDIENDNKKEISNNKKSKRRKSKKNSFSPINANLPKSNSTQFLRNPENQYLFSPENINSNYTNIINRNNTRRRSTLKKSQFNGVTIVNNIKDYLPQNITKEEIREMVYNVLEDKIVDDISKVIRGKTITKEQVDAIVNIVYDKVKGDKNDSDDENKKKNNNNNINEYSNGNNNIVRRNERRKSRRYSILNQVFVNIGLTDLTPEFVKNTVFRKKNPTQQQIDNAIKNISQGNPNVKVLTIELL